VLAAAQTIKCSNCGVVFDAMAGKKPMSTSLFRVLRLSRLLATPGAKTELVISLGFRVFRSYWKSIVDYVEHSRPARITVISQRAGLPPGRGAALLNPYKLTI